MKRRFIIESMRWMLLISCFIIVAFLSFRPHEKLNKDEIRNICYHMEVTKL